MDKDSQEPSQPTIPLSGYRYCPHCEQMVSNRTYRSHCMQKYSLDGTAAGTIGATNDGEGVDADCQTTASVPAGNDDHDCDDLLSVHDDPPMEEDDPLMHEHSFLGDTSDSDYDESSEYDSDEEPAAVTDNVVPAHQPADTVTRSLVRWFVIFICIWQTLFSLSDRAIEICLRFFGTFLSVLGSSSSSALVISVASALPVTLYLLRKYLKSERSDFISYVVCPSCFSLYKLSDCFQVTSAGDKEPIRCTFVRFPDHPHHHRRLPCNAHLLKKVHLTGGKVIYRPKYVYAYQPLKKSFAKLVKRPGFVDKLEHWRNREPEEKSWSDIYDGQVWKEFNSAKFNNFLKNKRCCGVMLNMDFFEPYKHVKDSYGVLYLSLMNLPRSERFKQENIMLLGILPHFRHEPPSLNTFLRPFVDELMEFWNQGVRLYTAESPKYKLLFKIALMCIACDIPAARKCCGFKSHNANLGCSRAKFFPGGFGPKDCSGFRRESWPTRQLKDHIETCHKLKACKTTAQIEAIETGTGIKYSVLIELPYFDPIRFTIVDPMHNLFLGTAKTMLKKVWLERRLITDHQFDLIQTRVDAMTVPSDIGRIPRKILSSFSGFTAEQWKNWVIIYSLFALRGILPDQDYDCWQSFVLACYFLCRRVITRAELMKADFLLIKFCQKVEDLYGKSVITPNMHLHAHLADCVKDYGSIYGYWLFSFERYNGTLGNFPTNKKCISEQLMRRFIYESECYHIPLPEIFGKEFAAVIPNQKCTEVHKTEGIDYCKSSFNDFKFIRLPSVSQYSSLGQTDFDHLATMYSYLYNGMSFISSEHVTRTIKVFKTISFYGRQFGSLRSPSTKSNAYIMASWAGNDGSVDENTKLRPGKVLFYILHKVMINGEFKDHLLACVSWYAEHDCYSLYKKPLEIWSKQMIVEGPAFFIPVQKIACRCAVCLSRIPCPSGEEQVLFVSPLSDLL